MKIKYPYRIKNNKKYYYYEYRDLYGKRKELSAPSIEKLEKKIQQLQINLATHSNPSSAKFEDYFSNWLTTVHLLNKKPSTKDKYVGNYKNHIKGSKLGSLKMNDLTVDVVQHFYQELFKKNDSQSIVESVHKLIAPCLRYAYGKGDIFRDFSRQLIIPKDREEKILKRHLKNSVKALTREEHIRFTEALKGNRDEAFYRTAIDGGYRKGELLALTWRDIDFKNHRIQINKTYSYVKNTETEKYVGVTSVPKTFNSTRCNKIPKVLVPILIQHKIEQKEELLAHGILQSEDTLVFCTPLGTHLDKNNVNKKLKNIFKSLNISEEHSFHDLRHTYATRQFELGMDIAVVSKLLGHSSTQITLNTYIHVLDGLKDATADATDLFYSNQETIPKTGGNIRLA